ncbi:MAG: hypothetical protein EA427_16545 [Spirochaetaceae bacterium]|nr:MAG: hypothetical protein EA427_16545 [Spirochaetaceae bacterium]
MEHGTSMQIKTKYALVHVPSARKCRSWAREVRRNRAAGLPPEHAGMQAARTVFPYEAREHYPPEALPVEEILAGIEA